MKEPRSSCARDGFPGRIVCLTEETVEILYELGAGDLVVGVSAYAKRPKEVLHKPRVSAFITAKNDKILDLNPDLVLTYCDLQADISRDLIKLGLPVYNFNQRTIEEIFSVIRQVGALVGFHEEAAKFVVKIEKEIDEIKNKASELKKRPRVYFEEWDEPLITGISWVGELIEIAGGIDLFHHLRSGVTAKERIIQHEQVIDSDPELVLASWCGKSFDRSSFMNRKGYDQIEAVKTNNVHEIDSTIILQPGPACLRDGLNEIHRFILKS